MNNLIVEFNHVEVGNIELAQGAQREPNRLVAVQPSRVGQLAAELSQGAEDPGPVETLPFAMFAVIHDYSASHNRRDQTPPLSRGHFHQPQRHALDRVDVRELSAPSLGDCGTSIE